MTVGVPQGLVIVLSIIGIGVIWFVLFGQRKYNELMKR